MMQQPAQVPAEIRLVPTERVPDRLFVCSAKIKPEAGTALKSAFEAGTGLPKELEANYNAHLIYAYDLGEKGSYWEAGPSADFTEILYIFAADGSEEAQQLMHHDPFYQEGIFYDDWWFEWAIHSPGWRMNMPFQEEGEMLRRSVGLLPKYPPGVQPEIIEIKVDLITPPKLFVSIAKGDAEVQEKIGQAVASGGTLPAFFLQHCFYKGGPGGTGRHGYDWECGPAVDSSYDLSIYSVNSIETAKFVRENDPMTKHGIFYDCTYFEWCIHMPLRKASPGHKEALKRFLRGAGIRLAG